METNKTSNICTISYYNQNKLIKEEHVIKDKKIFITYNPIKEYSDYNSRLKHTFYGWYLDKELTKEANEIVITQDISIYAKIVSEYKAKFYGDYVYFGSFPQTLVTDVALISILNNLKGTDENGYYEYLGNKYEKIKANPFSIFSTFLDDTLIEEKEYYFLVEPIEWKIIKSTENSYMLLSEKILINHKYKQISSNKKEKIYPNNYAHSDIRKMLNNTFYNKAFIDFEQNSILTTLVDNSAKTTNDIDNPYTCDNTEDKVFLLSYQEAHDEDLGFSQKEESQTRQKVATDYCCALGIWTEDNNISSFWYRSPLSNDSECVATAFSDGSISEEYVENEEIGVLPVINIKKLF